MAKQGAALQTYNNELVKCLEELCHNRKQLQDSIDRDEDEKARLDKQLREIQSRLDAVNARLDQKLAKREQYDKTINDSERAYHKILESSQVLLNVVKKDAKELNELSKL